MSPFQLLHIRNGKKYFNVVSERIIEKGKWQRDIKKFAENSDAHIANLSSYIVLQLLKSLHVLTAQTKSLLG